MIFFIEELELDLDLGVVTRVEEGVMVLLLPPPPQELDTCSQRLTLR